METNVFFSIVRINTCGVGITQNCTYITNPSYPTTYTTTGKVIRKMLRHVLLGSLQKNLLNLFETHSNLSKKILYVLYQFKNTFFVNYHYIRNKYLHFFYFDNFSIITLTVGTCSHAVTPVNDGKCFVSNYFSSLIFLEWLFSRNTL